VSYRLGASAGMKASATTAREMKASASEVI
jgi:hypothetical protein